MHLTLEKSILFLDEQVKIQNPKLLADYQEMTRWALSIGNQTSLIQTAPNPTGVGTRTCDLRFTLISETKKRKKNFLIFKSGGKLQLPIPAARESGLLSREYKNKYKRLKGNENIIEFDAATATKIPLDDKIAMASLAYCLLIENRYGSEIDSCLSILRPDPEPHSTDTMSHPGCFQPKVTDWDQTLKLLSKNGEKVDINDVFKQIRNQKEEDGDTLCPDWREILTEELKQRELRLSADGYTN